MTMACAVCASIPDIARANTGRDEHFDAPITDLKRHELSQSDDLRECPECGALFLWQDDRSFTGSGNNDEEVLTRFSADETALLRAFIDRGERAAEEVAREASRWLALPEVVRGLVSTRVLHGDRELARALLPRLLGEIASGFSKHEFALSFVKSYASHGDAEAAFLMSELSRRPAAPALDGLRAYCKRTLCSICRGIDAFFSPVTARRESLPAPLGSLTQLGASDDLDAWECPECDAMFMWRGERGAEGTLSRIHDSAALRACVHREGVIPELAREMVFASDGRRELRIVLALGMRRDREMLRQFAPRMILELVLNEAAWLDDLLCELAAGSVEDARALLTAIEGSSRTNARVASVAECCRRALGARVV